jgi:hypothetical protein
LLERTRAENFQLRNLFSAAVSTQRISAAVFGQDVKKLYSVPIADCAEYALRFIASNAKRGVEQ